MESVNLRKFNENDIEKKIKWINDHKNNEFFDRSFLFYCTNK